jgi:catecholate siderophore receptor
MACPNTSSKTPFQLPPRTLISVAIGLAFASGSMPAFAEPQLDTTAQETELPTVTVDGAPIEVPQGGYKPVKASSPKYTEPLRDTPQSITVVPQQVIQDRAATSLRDVMRNVSGISLVAGEGGGAQGDNFRIRGFAANNDLFLDGMRDLAQTSRDPFNLDSVEVAKGPSSSIAGRGATGGAINQVSKTPFLESLRSGTFMLGTDATKRITADINEPLKGYGPDVALRLNAMVHDAEVEDRDEIYQKRWGIAPSLAIGLGTATRYTLSLFHQDDDNLPDYGLPFFAGVPVRINGERLNRSNYYGLKDFETEETEATALTFKVEHDFSESLSLRNQTRYSRNTRLAVVGPPRNPNVAADTVQRGGSNSLAGRDAKNILLINQTDITKNIKVGTIEHSIVGGVELSRESFDNQAFSFPGVPTTSLSNPDPDTPYTGSRLDGVVTDNSATGLATYVSDTIKLDEHWQLIGGLRWDRFALDGSTVDAMGVETEADRSDSETSGRVAAVYKPVENASFYAGYGTSFNPSAEALTLSTSGTASNNVDLAPETNRSLELGTKWDVLDEHLALTGALFRIEKTNARTRDTGDPNSIIALDGEQVVDGIELGISGNLSRNWQVIAGTTYLFKCEITKSNTPAEEGNELGNCPDKTLNFWTTYQLPSNFEVGFGGLYVSERKVSNTLDTDLESYTLFDAMLGYQLNPRIKLQANLSNLTDELYFDRYHAGGQHGIPGAGRTLLLSANFKY